MKLHKPLAVTMVAVVLGLPLLRRPRAMEARARLLPHGVHRLPRREDRRLDRTSTKTRPSGPRT